MVIFPKRLRYNNAGRVYGLLLPMVAADAERQPLRFFIPTGFDRDCNFVGMRFQLLDRLQRLHPRSSVKLEVEISAGKR